jgi:hypothetical protein
MAAAALEKRSGLLKNAPLVAGSGWGRNDTPTHSDPVSHGMVNRERARISFTPTTTL